jgi:hypothetical protein
MGRCLVTRYRNRANKLTASGKQWYHRVRRPAGDGDLNYAALDDSDAGLAGSLARGRDERARPARPPDAAPAPGRGAGRHPAASGRRRAARLPHRHQLRPRRRHRHRPAGQPGDRPHAERLRGVRGRQAADDRDLPLHQGRQCRARVPTRAIRTRADEEIGGQQDDARIFVFFLDDYHVRRGSSHVGARSRWPSSSAPARAERPGGGHVPADAARRVVLTRDHESA